MGCNTLVHGSNTRNLSVYPSLSQANKNAMSFYYHSCLLFSKIGEEGRTGSAWKPVGGGGTQIMYTHVSNVKMIKIKNIYIQKKTKNKSNFKRIWIKSLRRHRNN
jgi:hypothetical protein